MIAQISADFWLMTDETAELRATLEDPGAAQPDQDKPDKPDKPDKQDK